LRLHAYFLGFDQKIRHSNHQTGEFFLPKPWDFSTMLLTGVEPANIGMYSDIINTENPWNSSKGGSFHQVRFALTFGWMIQWMISYDIILYYIKWYYMLLYDIICYYSLLYVIIFLYVILCYCVLLYLIIYICYYMLIYVIIIIIMFFFLKKKYYPMCIYIYIGDWYRNWESRSFWRPVFHGTVNG
jgi:hypothetical protein